VANKLDESKQRFSKSFEQCLRRAYGGKLPSLSTIARDLSLRCPHLAHVSSETVRKWLRGKAIPHSLRMQALANWLGNDLLLALDTIRRSPASSANAYVAPETKLIEAQQEVQNSEILRLLNGLDSDNFALVMKLAQSLSDKSPNIDHRRTLQPSSQQVSALQSKKTNQPKPS